MADDHMDMHEFRMSLGTTSMDLADAIGDDFLRLVADLEEPFIRLFERLVDSGVSESVVVGMMHGFVAHAIESVRS